jgi:hypothetical protein
VKTHYLQSDDPRMSYAKNVPHSIGGNNYGPGTRDPARVTCAKCLAWLASSDTNKGSR